MSANVGYATLSVVPSLKGMQAALERDGGPAVRAFGKDAGDRIGTNLQRSMADKFGATKLPVDKLAKQGDKLGDEIGGRVRKGVEEHTSRISFGKMAAGLGGILGGAGLLSLGQESFKAFSDLNESKSKAIVVFGDSFGVVDAQAQNAAKSLGISRQAALESAATFGNLFRAMGLSQDTAAGMSTNLNQLASDLASFNNANPDDVLIALKAGLVGETEPLRRFGVNLNQARIEAEALRIGLVHGTVDMVDVRSKTLAVEKATKAVAQATKEHGAGSLEARDAVAQQAKAQQDLEQALAGNVPELNAAQKAQAAYSLILQDTTLAQGDFARTADGAANKGRIAAAQFEDLKATLGEKAAPFGNALLTGAIAGLDGLTAWWDEHGPGLQTWFHDTFGEDPAANFRTGLEEVRRKLDEIHDAWNSVFSAPTPSDNTPFQQAADSLAGLTGPKQTSPFEDFAIGVYQKIGPPLEWLGEKLVAVKDYGLDPFFGTMQEGLPILGKTFADMGSFIVDHFLDPLWGILQKGTPIILETFGQMAGAVVDVDNALYNLEHTLLDAGWGTIETIFSKLLDLAQSLMALTSGGPNPVASWILHALGIPGFDTGGVVPGAIGSPQLVLAHGGETILPTHKSPGLAASGAGAAGIGAAPIVQNFYNVRESETAWRVRHEMRQLAQGAGRR